MKERKLFDAIGQVSEELIEEAGNTALKTRRNRHYIYTSAAAAVALLAGVLALTLSNINKPEILPTAQSGESISEASGNSDNTQDISGEESDSHTASLIPQTTVAAHATAPSSGQKTTVPTSSAITDSGNPQTEPEVSARQSPVPGHPIYAVKYPDGINFNDTMKIMENYLDNQISDSFKTSLNQFSYKTAGDLFAHSSGNVNYSPLSLYLALAMVTTGAGTGTRSQLLSLLGVSDTVELSNQCAKLYRQLYTDNNISQLKIANSLWMDGSVAWKDAFVSNAAENFYAPSFSVDFKDSTTFKRMSDWVAQNTNNKLQPQFQPDIDTVMSIINTVYFYDEWVYGFFSTDNKTGDFYLSGGGSVKADFMIKTQDPHYFYRGENFLRSYIHLKNGGKMEFILPTDGANIADLIASERTIEDAFSGGTEYYGKVVWQIPKFRFGSVFELPDTLKRLGVTSAFEGSADFSLLSDTKTFISSVKQETVIGIDENGVEAAAYTVINIASAGLPNENLAEMTLDKPFMFKITAKNGTTLFAGICENPSLS